MNAGQGGEQCLEGLQLLEAAKWDAAREAFEAALAKEETPDVSVDGVPGKGAQGRFAQRHCRRPLISGGAAPVAWPLVVFSSNHY